jgi:hypothetical protein
MNVQKITLGVNIVKMFMVDMNVHVLMDMNWLKMKRRALVRKTNEPE